MSAQAPDLPLGVRRPTLSRSRQKTLVIGAVAAVVAACVVFLATTDGFATWGNVKAFLVSSSYVGMIAAGQALIMISGNFFSMSLGVQVAGSAMFFLYALSLGLVPAIVLTIVICGLISALQGYAAGAWEANPIVVTIASNVLLVGIIVLITEGANVYPPADGPSIDFLRTQVGGIGISVFVMLGVVLAVQYFLSGTRFGAATFLTGGNRPAARAAGMPVISTIVIVFTIAGVCAGIAGVMLSGFQQTATLQLQGTLVFDSIAAVLVGGCAVAGGRGSVISAAIGTIAISAVNSALTLRGYSLGIEILVKGSIVLFAVLCVHVLKRGGSE